MSFNQAKIEKMLLESALDEDPVLSAINNIIEASDFEKNDVIDACEDLCSRGLLGFYTYSDEKIHNIPCHEFRQKLSELEFDLYLVQSDTTFDRLSEISSAPSV